MPYRTRTYIAGDWTGDENLISHLKFWNENSHWNLSYIDAHELTQAKDTSLPCSIKRSLKERLDVSKTFVLVVGEHTKDLTKGGCRHCGSYSIYGGCHRSGTVDHRSFIDYECEYAVKNRLKIVVLYNGCSVMRNKCPEAIRREGLHIPAVYRGTGGKLYWDVGGISRAIRS